MHIYSLAVCLRKLGHKVIIITHAYKCKNSKRTGVRYLPGPIKVYYCPIIPMTDQDALPTFSATLPLLRHIWIREAIDVVHSHQATSTLAHEAIAYATELGLPSVYTDHSLFGVDDDLASVILNRVLKTSLSTVGAVICVSHTCRENLILRANMDPTLVHAVPNAIDASKFQPDFELVKERIASTQERVKIVVISRLVYRKGVDLLVGIIPRICNKHSNVDFIIGGDGTKKLALEEMVERERLQDRVEFLGSVPHSNVRNVLVRGHIFLNCSLTESFCIAILEAASCGLFVVATNVGGVPEVLPPEMILMAKPNVKELTSVLETAILEKVGCDGGMAFDPVDFHERISEMYSWNRVAKKTVSVYKQVLQKKRLTFLQRLARYKSIGPFAGYFACLLSVTLHFIVIIIEWWQPRHLIDVVPDLVSPDEDGSTFMR
jgi:phosphatidylinositol glycan class A protein